MAIELIVNGIGYNFPEPDDQDWGQDVTDWAYALTTSMLTTSGGIVEFLNDLDVGSLSGIISMYYKSRSPDIAQDGVLRLSNTDTINFRNAANDGDVVISIEDDGLKINGESVGYRFISEMEDALITTPLDNQFLLYDGTSSKWINKTLSISDIDEIDLSGVVNGDYLKFNGTSWTPVKITHDEITNRNELDQHSIESITNLRSELTIINNTLNAKTDIDDNTTNLINTWSSQKIQDTFDSKTDIDDTAINGTNAWSSQKINSITSDLDTRVTNMNTYLGSLVTEVLL